MLVTRDPFARAELHKTRDKNAECAECGQRDPGHRLAYQGDRPLHRIYRFRIETDGGSISEDRKTFCTRQCRSQHYGLL